MGQPVKLSGQLVSDARSCAELTERSIAGQIEYWAGIGRAMDAMMRLNNVLALKKSVTIGMILERLAQVDTPTGRQQVKETLARKPFPHYERVDDRPGFLVRIDADGTRTVGRLVGRQFISD